MKIVKTYQVESLEDLAKYFESRARASAVSCVVETWEEAAEIIRNLEIKPKGGYYDD